MASIFQKRFPGARWQIRYAKAGYALTELQRAVQARLPYVLEVRAESGPRSSEENLLLLGTPEDHPRIRAMGLDIPDAPQSYAIARKGPVLALAGRDEAGVLHAVADFAAHRLAGIEGREAFDALPGFSASSTPKVARRGIWTWGYVIHDYRGFLDRMARLRMNTLTIWNDEPPLNAPEVLDYAHARGIEVILGFAWGWGRADLDLSSEADRRKVGQEVLEEYRTRYRHLKADGIYFQTLTEHTEREKGGRSTAAWACDWVNAIARPLMDEFPGLPIRFGLHATSIEQDYGDLSGLDPRVMIDWEDAGVIPYSYDPVTDLKQTGQHLGRFVSPEETLDYSRKLARLRPGCPFSMVPKGWTCLGWREEFEHHGPFILGERDPVWIRRRLESRKARWDDVNARWEKLFPLAARFYREMLKENAEGMSVTGLVEDGVFEARIPLSVALFAETLWDPTRPDAELLAAARRLAEDGA